MHSLPRKRRPVTGSRARSRFSDNHDLLSGPRVAHSSHVHGNRGAVTIHPAHACRPSIDARHPSTTSTRCRASVEDAAQTTGTVSPSPLWRAGRSRSGTHPPTNTDGSPVTILDFERFHRLLGVPWPHHPLSADAFECVRCFACSLFCFAPLHWTLTPVCRMLNVLNQTFNQALNTPRPSTRRHPPR